MWVSRLRFLWTQAAKGGTRHSHPLRFSLEVLSNATCAGQQLGMEETSNAGKLGTCSFKSPLLRPKRLHYSK